jgi:hypothetical protein
MLYEGQVAWLVAEEKACVTTKYKYYVVAAWMTVDSYDFAKRMLLNKRKVGTTIPHRTMNEESAQKKHL